MTQRFDKLQSGRLPHDPGALRKGLDAIDQRHVALSKTVAAIQKDIIQLEADLELLWPQFPGLPRSLQ